MSETDFDLQQLLQDARGFVKAGELDQAIAMYQAASEMVSGSRQLHEGYGRALIHKGQPQAAVVQFQLAHQADPARSGPLVRLGAAYNQLGQFDYAIGTLQQALQRDSQSIDAYYHLGYAHRKRNEYDMSQAAFKELLRLNPQDADGYFQLAKVYRDSGNLRQALIQARKALEIEPTMKPAKALVMELDELIAESRENLSPFGRLVPQPRNADEPPTESQIHLSEAQRARDHSRLLGISREAQNNGLAMLNSLKQDLSLTIETMRKRMAHGITATSDMIHLQDNYRQHARDVAGKRRLLNRILLQLKAHEELIAHQGNDQP